MSKDGAPSAHGDITRALSQEHSSRSARIRVLTCVMGSLTRPGNRYAGPALLALQPLSDPTQSALAAHA